MSGEHEDPRVIRISYRDLQGNAHSETHEIFADPPFESIPTKLGSVISARPPPGEWSRLAGLADEWFLAHLQLSRLHSGYQSQLSPWLFSAGHAIELYLKSVVTAHETMEKAISFGHKLSDLWRRCEQYDGFPLSGLLRNEFLDLDCDIYSAGSRSDLALEIRRHLAHNELLYLALRHVQDLKYLGAPGKTFREIRLSFGTTIPNKAIIIQLGKIAHWAWGQWACRPGYNNASLYESANQLLERASG